MPDRTEDEARRAAAQAIAADANKEVDDASRPRLTPQNRADPAAAGEDTTAPSGAGAQHGQPDKAEGETDASRVAEALKRPSREEGAMHFGAKPADAAPEGSADAAVERAAAGWSGRRENEQG
ncbi:MAG: hypothetical protein ACFE0R_10580 [Salinarimonas sp.]